MDGLFLVSGDDRAGIQCSLDRASLKIESMRSPHEVCHDKGLQLLVNVRRQSADGWIAGSHTKVCMSSFRAIPIRCGKSPRRHQRATWRRLT
jgi:hypothetical protein